MGSEMCIRDSTGTHDRRPLADRSRNRTDSGWAHRFAGIANWICHVQRLSTQADWTGDLLVFDLVTAGERNHSVATPICRTISVSSQLGIDPYDRIADFSLDQQSEACCVDSTSDSGSLLHRVFDFVDQPQSQLE